MPATGQIMQRGEKMKHGQKPGQFQIARANMKNEDQEEGDYRTLDVLQLNRVTTNCHLHKNLIEYGKGLGHQIKNNHIRQVVWI